MSVLHELIMSENKQPYCWYPKQPIGDYCAQSCAGIMLMNITNTLRYQRAINLPGLYQHSSVKTSSCQISAEQLFSMEKRRL